MDRLADNIYTAFLFLLFLYSLLLLLAPGLDALKYEVQNLS
jgi:hypothetical protein